MSRDDADPGWGPALRTLPVMVFPFVGMSRAVKSPDSLMVMRALWLLFAGAVTVMGLMALVVSSVDGLDGALGQTPALAIAAGVSVFAQLATARLASEPDLGGETVFVSSFQRWFFVRVAAAEVAAIVSFALFIASAAPLVYFVGGVVALAGLWDVRPGRTRLRRLQTAADDLASGLRVVPALERSGLTR